MISNINGVESAYESCGNGERNLLLLHGWGCNGTLMQPVAKELQVSFRILIPDFPGHGKSGRPPEPWGVPEYAAWLKQLLAETGFSPCCVIAHSFGCRVAAWLAAEEPSLFERMVFTGAAGIRPKPTPEKLKRNEQYKKLKGICEAAKKIPLLSSAAEKMEDRLRKKYGSRDYNALDAEMRKTFVKVISLDLSDLYPKIRSSVLLIWGSADNETPLWMGQEMEKLIPDAGLAVLENGTHFAYLEQTGRFVLIVREFLKEEA